MVSVRPFALLFFFEGMRVAGEKEVRVSVALTLKVENPVVFCQRYLEGEELVSRRSLHRRLLPVVEAAVSECLAQFGEEELMAPDSHLRVRQEIESKLEHGTTAQTLMIDGIAVQRARLDRFEMCDVRQGVRIEDSLARRALIRELRRLKHASSQERSLRLQQMEQEAVGGGLYREQEWRELVRLVLNQPNGSRGGPRGWIPWFLTPLALAGGIALLLAGHGVDQRDGEPGGSGEVPVPMGKRNHHVVGGENCIVNEATMRRNVLYFRRTLSSVVGQVGRAPVVVEWPDSVYFLGSAASRDELERIAGCIALWLDRLAERSSRYLRLADTEADMEMKLYVRPTDDGSLDVRLLFLRSSEGRVGEGRLNVRFEGLGR
jgi:hypothetical protein